MSYRRSFETAAAETLTASVDAGRGPEAANGECSAGNM
jgi:hypothetical protein